MDQSSATYIGDNKDMGFFSKLFDMFLASGTDNSASISSDTEYDITLDSSSLFDDSDHGINPSTGLNMMNSTFDIGGHFWGESDSSSLFDSSSSGGFSDSFSSGSMFDE